MGADRLCDPAFEDCQAALIALIDNERVGIDVAFWFMEDGRLSAALERAARERNVKIRVIFDSEALPNEPVRQFVVDTLVNAHIPMREKVDAGINHWKLMLFAGQNVLQFSGANHTAEAFKYEVPYSAYVDEVIYFTDKESLVDSFKTRFDDIWTSTTGMMANYANVTTIERHYDPPEPIDSELNFGPFDSFRDRSTSTYRAEPTRIDAIIYRITDRAHTDTLIDNVQRHIGFRLITEPHQYRDESRLWHSWNVDRLYKAGLLNPIDGQPGIQIRHRLHAGLTHEKLSIMIGSGVTVFGSSNWTSASSDYQLEHNLFTHDPAFYTWARNHFERKWNNLGGAPETTPFVPLPPDRPVLAAPTNGATAQPLTVTLQWHAGPWAHRYDVYLGTNQNNLVKVVDDQELGPYDIATTIPGPLLEGTLYYWRVVSRTMADQTQTSDTFSFVTQGTASTNAPPSVALTSPTNGASFTAPASITMTAAASDPDGTVKRVDFFAGSTLVGSATSAPFTFTWSNAPAGGYSLTAKAVDNLDAATTSTGVTISVTPGSGGSLPAPWADGDIGAVGQAGGATVNAGTWTVTGSGADVWGTSDQFHYTYQLLTDDGTIVARVATLQNVDQWTKAGVMLRESLTPGSAHAFMLVTPAGSTKGLAFQRRTATSGLSTHSAGGDGAPPAWVRLTRSGPTITAYRSADGVNWTLVGSDTIVMGTTIYAGLAVNSHSAGALATATFDNVSVTPAGPPPPPANAPPSVSLTAPAPGATFAAPAAITVSANAFDSDGTIAKVDFYAGSTLVGTDATSPYSISWNNVPAASYSLTARATDTLGAEAVSGAVTIQVTSVPPPPSLPTGWSNQDIGPVAVAGSASFSTGVFTLRGSGADIWGTADQFQFAYRTLTGNGSIVARVQGIENVDPWTKAGVMIRASLTPGSRHAMMIASSSKGLAFQRRTVDDASSVHTAGPAVTAPIWVRLQRNIDVITGSISNDGVNWSVVGTETISLLPNTVFIGLPLTSHSAGVAATATIDNVTVTVAP